MINPLIGVRDELIDEIIKELKILKHNETYVHKSLQLYFAIKAIEYAKYLKNKGETQ